MKIGVALLLALVPLVTSGASAVAGVLEGKAAWATGDYAAALVQLRPAAEAGDPEAQFYLGEAYRLGRSVTADSDQAMVWYRRAAALGNTRARDALGLSLFASGKRAEAMPLLEKAAASGDSRALYVLGTAHFNGDNTTRDWPLAYAMMMRASASGLPQAKTSLEVMDRYLFPADKVKAQALYAQITSGAPAPALASAAAAARPPAPTSAPVSRPAAAPATPLPLREAVQKSSSVVAAPRSSAPGPAPEPAVAARTPVAAGGAWRVQLGAFGSADRADATWARLTAKVPALKRLDRRVIAAGSVQRLQAAGVADRTAANDLCKAVSAAGGDCLAIAPERR